MSSSSSSSSAAAAIDSTDAWGFATARAEALGLVEVVVVLTTVSWIDGVVELSNPNLQFCKL
jgi:hypothetical protein